MFVSPFKLLNHLKDIHEIQHEEYFTRKQLNSSPPDLLLTHFLIYLLTPCSRVLLEKLTGSQLAKKFPAFYGNRRLTAALKSTRHLSLSWARSVQSTPTSQFLKSRLNIILLSMPRSSKLPISLKFPYQNPVCTFPLPHTC